MDVPEKKFKSFNETFPYCTFGLAIALIYPNTTNVRKRLLLFCFVMFMFSILLIWFLLYLFKCMYNLDMFNLARQITVGILELLFIFKTIHACRKVEKFAQILNKITEDLLEGNEMEEDYQMIYEYYIKIGKVGEICWVFIPILLSLQFGLYAASGTIYETLKSDVGKKYMIHEMELKYIEDKQFETPYYEILFAYNFLAVIVVAPNFAGFDGSFCIATNHLRLKLKVLAHKVSKAFKDAESRDQLEIKLKETIRDHQDALVFYNDIQEVYGGWLFSVFLLTSLIISLNIYQIYLNNQIDPKYTFFAISGVIHMLTPCYFSSSLMKVNCLIYTLLSSLCSLFK